MWKTIFKEMPINKSTYWIRVLNVYGELAVAEFIAERQIFKTIDTGIEIPMFMVSRYKIYH